MEELFNEFEQYLDDVDEQIIGITNKEFDDLLINQTIVSTHQFVVYTLENIEYAVFCYKIIQSLYRKMINRRNDLYHNTETGIIDLKNLPDDFDILGNKKDYPSLYEIYVRDCFQYQMNAFDTMNHIVSVGLLLENRNSEQRVKRYDIIKKLERMANFPLVLEWYNNLSKDKRFKYINHFNNRTKHTSGIKINTSIPLLGRDRSSIGAFSRGGKVIFEKELLYDKLDKSLRFTINKYLELLKIFKEECVKVNHTIERYHIKKVKSAKNNCLFAYIESDQSLDEMPEKIEVLFVKKPKEENKGLLSAKEFPFEHIKVLDKKGDYIGSYKSSNDFVDDPIAHYHLYSKMDISEKYSKEKFDNIAFKNVLEYGLPE